MFEDCLMDEPIVSMFKDIIFRKQISIRMTVKNFCNKNWSKAMYDPNMFQIGESKIKDYWHNTHLPHPPFKSNIIIIKSRVNI